MILSKNNNLFINYETYGQSLIHKEKMIEVE